LQDARAIPMKYLPLILAGLWRKPARTVFTFLSIVVAFILFGILSAIDGGLAHQVEVARLDRLMVDTKFGTNLPLAYLDRIAQIPGVTVVAPRQILVGYYKDQKSPFGVVMTDRRFFAVRPELNATREQIDTLLKTRTAALVTVFSAKRFGWKVGQRVPIISNTVRKDGGHAWTFDIVGIIDDVDHPGKSRYFISNYDYMDQERVTEKGTVDRILVRIKDPARATATSRAIDAMFANSAAPTRTASEKSQTQSGVRSIGDIGFFTRAVVGAVLFMLLFLTGNTMMQSVRERTPEFAVLKTLGYSDGAVLALVLAESAILCLLAAMAGLALAKFGIPRIADFAPETGQILLMPWSALLTGLGFALLVAFVSGVIPALRAKRLSIVDALTSRP
ncbi:MAG TPA: ABC transporter permease, partial [Rhizomicrobium sp.]|nr:ABC transporter permease [Rhizomicrobium sp.]